MSYVAQQVKVEEGEYGWSGRAIKRHRLKIRGVFGFRECTEEDQGRLAEWLAVELCREAAEPVSAGGGGRGGPLAQGPAGAAGPRTDGWWARRSAPSRNGSARPPRADCRRRPGSGWTT
ncbi:DUF4158 domain-containing protein [Streptomyces achmelvichensis]|uniref:DUF4158 domain-containing protein n=1 Tax=Streptomyces achmelvichensis TaxID=3134111 RepID=UPI003C12C545